MASTEVVVGRIGKAHGVKGEVSVELRTDEPARRFADRAVLSTQAPHGGEPVRADRPATLTVKSTRWHQSRLLVTFEEVADRTRADEVRGLLLAVEVDASESPEDPEEFYDHQIVGLRVETPAGGHVGEVTEMVHSPGQDLLSIRGEDGREILVPFVSALVPVVDVSGGRLVVEDLPGLLRPAVEDEDGGA